MNCRIRSPRGIFHAFWTNIIDCMRFGVVPCYCIALCEKIKTITITAIIIIIIVIKIGKDRPPSSLYEGAVFKKGTKC